MLPPLRIRHAQRSDKLSFASDSNIEPVGFVATKKMKLLSGNPDGLLLSLNSRVQGKWQKINQLLS